MKRFSYPLLSNAFNKKDIDIGVNVIKSTYVQCRILNLQFAKA